MNAQKEKLTHRIDTKFNESVSNRIFLFRIYIKNYLLSFRSISINPLQTIYFYLSIFGDSTEKFINPSSTVPTLDTCICNCGVRGVPYNIFN